jgi:NOL1/NOP2/fmu family ribosome biogenesis protein
LPELRKLDPAGRQEILDYFEARFGIEAAVFDSVELLERGIHIWCVAASPALPAVLGWRIETPGIRLLRRTNFGFKPTTFGLQVFGSGATRNVVRLPWAEANRFAKGETITGFFDLEPGYVIVRVEEFVLGCGLYKPDGRLLSQMPKYVWAEVRAEG